MKIFKLYDNGLNMTLGHLLAFEKDKNFIVELKEKLDEWTAPLLFTAYIKKAIFTMPRDITLSWVRERIIPSNRQNISMILANHKLKSYDELRLLEISEGICSQDNIVLKRIDSIPEYIQKRMEKNLSEIVLSDDSLLTFFNDDTARKIPLENLYNIEGASKLANFRKVLESGKVGSGGYYVTFNDSIDIPAATLYKTGIKLPLKKSDFINFSNKNILDTTESCRILKCSRQNIAYLLDRDQLHPIKENVKGNLYLKGDLLRCRD